MGCSLKRWHLSRDLKKGGGWRGWNQPSRHLGVECCRQMEAQVQLFWERIKPLLLEGQQEGGEGREGERERVGQLIGVEIQSFHLAFFKCTSWGKKKKISAEGCEH